MSGHCYPVFEPGQTLTAEDLNVLRDFLDEQDRLTRRLVGFGVVCGLDGSIAGTTLTIDPGLAIDQDGNGLLLPAATGLSITGPVDERTFEFVDSSENGRTAVLLMESVEQPAPECSEEGCEGHAGVVCREPTVVLVEGKLTDAELAFAAEPLLAAEPVRVSATGAVHGAFVGLKNTILTRWRDEGITLSEDAQSVMRDLAIESSDLPGVKALKAGFLNEVLFATLDLLQCRALHAAVCLRSADPAGVALGWIDDANEWHCSFRHHFAPPSGMASALFGGGCEDPCALYLRRLDSLVAHFRVPTTPAPGDPPDPGPNPGDFPYCPGWKIKGRNHDVTSWLTWIDCDIYEVPPFVIEDLWRDRYRTSPDLVNPWDPLINPIPETWDLYGDHALDLTGKGVITLTRSLGKDASEAERVLNDVIGSHGVTPDVRVMTMTETAEVGGFQHKTTVSAGDTVVVVTDDHGKVVSTGRISNSATVHGANRGISETATLSNEAAAKATNAAQTVEAFDNRLGGAEETLVTLQAFQTETLQWQAETGPKVNAIPGAVQGAVNAAMTGVDAKIAGLIDSKFAGLAERTARVETQVGSLTERAGVTERRVDDVFKIRAGLRAPGAVVGADVNRSLVTVLGGLRSSMETAIAGRPGAPAVRAILRESADAFATLEARASAAEPLTMTAPDELARVLGSLVEAAGRAGVPEGEINLLNREVSGLMEGLGRGGLRR